MTGLDRRHRWSDVTRNGSQITHTCRACGLTRTFEALIPDAVLDALLQEVNRPNPLRQLARMR